MLALLRAPVSELQTLEKAGEQVSPTTYHRDAAILETIYSCGLRVSELCGLRAEDINWNEQLVRVRGKGKKERQVPIGAPALDAIRKYWDTLPQPPSAAMPVFLSNANRVEPMSPASCRCGSNVIWKSPVSTQSHAFTNYAIVTPRTCSTPGPICEASRNCLATRIWPPSGLYPRDTERLKKAYDKAHPRA